MDYLDKKAQFDNMNTNIINCNDSNSGCVGCGHQSCSCGVCPAYCPTPVSYPDFSGKDTTYPDFKATQTDYPDFSSKDATYPDFEGVKAIYPTFVEKIIEIPICKPVYCNCFDCCDICEEQLKYVIEQLIVLYPDDNWIINLEGNKNVSGRPIEIVDDINKGLLVMETKSELTELIKTEYVSICRIASIKLTSAKYDPSIQYLPVPKTPTQCGCYTSIYTVLESAGIGSTVQFDVGGESTGNGTLIQNRIAMAVIEVGANLEFVNTCRVDSFVIS